MLKSYTDYKSIVDFLVKVQKKTFDQAFTEAGVPSHFLERIKNDLDPSFVKIHAPSLLVDSKTQKAPLLTILPDDAPQPYLTAYLRHLANVKEWDQNILANLEDTSKRIVARFPDPGASATFRSQGLVVGYVQSGKTANMGALIARAVDQGYRLIIILAGLYKDLRKQTQERFDQDLTGRPSDLDPDLVVKHDEGTPRWVHYTGPDLNGDFRVTNAEFDPNPRSPKLAVLKKHPSVLKNFRNWISQRDPAVLRDFPALIIDDECDQASINTKYGLVDEETGEPLDPSKTNLRIRELLSAFPKVTYVGFTATPFANVLVDATEDQDLYPKDFIAVLEEPPGYCGARKMFGLGMSSSALSPEESHDPQLKLIRELDDADLASLDEVEAGTGSSELLTEAILTFILSCCARLHRDLDDHFSMLIHPSHEKYVHEAFRSIVDEELQTIRQACLNPKSFKPILDQARRIWETNFIPTSRSAGITDLPDFDTIWKFAKGIVSEINILVLNSDSNDVLNYKTSVRQRYIVIGGNRLSRGLTLEGLAVSIFLRNSDKYDTLLQMGRWFGYRNGYLDLTRLYVSGEMADAFADLARVEDELRADLQQYAAQKDPPTPLEIMPKIRAHESLSVTSYLKLGAGQRVNISLQGKRVETVSLPLKKPSALKSNQTATSAWLSTLGRPVGGSSTEDGFTWTDVPHTKIVEFINSYTFSEGARTTNRTFLIDYILKQVGYKELRMWDVIVPSGSRNRDVYPLAPGVAINKVQRSKLKTKKDTNSIRVVASPSDITGWRETFKRDPKDQDRGALFIYVIDKQSAGRDGQNPLFGQGADAIDVIGLTFVFPTSVSNATVEYVTQEAP